MGLRDYLGKFVRRKTPTPLDKEVFNLGIQERRHPQHMLGPVLYHVANQSTIVRTCITQLKTEIFRRGYVWEKAFYKKCVDCGSKFDKDVSECSNCGSTNLKKASLKQKEYAEKFFEGYVNKSEQKFIDVLKEIEADLNIADDAYLILERMLYHDCLLQSYLFLGRRICP